MLADTGTASWESWNVFAGEFARDTGARVVRVEDGGITGPAFSDHVRGLRRPVLNSPKGQTTPLPPGPTRRPVVHPSPFWTWSSISRQNETRTAIQATIDATIDALSRDTSPPGLDAATTWMPPALSC